jgi:hypothetical protein
MSFNDLLLSNNKRVRQNLFTVPVNERLDEFASVELVVAVCVVHLEVVELQLLLRHVGRVDWNVHVFLHVPRSNSFY